VVEGGGGGGGVWWGEEGGAAACDGGMRVAGVQHKKNVGRAGRRIQPDSVRRDSFKQRRKGLIFLDTGHSLRRGQKLKKFETIGC
jgi:hypothetical protein